MAKEKDPRLKRAKVEGFNEPRRTPNHPTKSHIVVAKVGDKVKTIRFGQQGAKTAGKPKKGESEAVKQKRKSFKARHAKNIAKGKMSAAYWADRVKWWLSMPTVDDAIARIDSHEKECLLRYQNIEQRLESGSKRFDKLELMLWGVYPFIITVVAVFKWM